MTELKPCPFCGGPAKVSKSGGNSEVDGYTTFHTVGCSKCGIHRFAHSKPYGGPEPEEAIGLAVSLWNTREPEIDLQVVNDLYQGILESKTLSDLYALRATVSAIIMSYPPKSK